MIIYQQEFITYNDRSDRRWKIYHPEFSGQAFGLLSGKQDGAGLCIPVYERIYASGGGIKAASVSQAWIRNV